MAGKKKAAEGALSPEVQSKVAEIKAEADKQFLNQDWSKAIERYEEAIKVLGDAPEKVEFLQKTAHCYLKSRKYKEAVKASTAILDLKPSATVTSHALKTRAKANEGLGFFKQALADTQMHVEASDSVSEEMMAMERRLKDVISANKAKLSGGSPTAGSPSATAAKNANPNGFPYVMTVKATLDGDTRVLSGVSIMASYFDLYEAIKAKFPSAGPFVLKYTDKEGALVTMTSRQDIQIYVTELITQYQRQHQQMGGPKLNANQLPPMKVQVVKVALESEVPQPPDDELPPAVKAAAAAMQQEQAAQQEYELDDWVVKFARAFSEITGIDPMTHHEHIGMAADKLARVTDAALSDEKAQPLFDQATEHFRSSTSNCLVQWGSVMITKADRLAQIQLKSGKPFEGKVVDAALKEYDEAEKKYNEALKIKTDSWEATASLGQLEWERAKARLGYIVPSPSVDEAKQKEAEEAKESVAVAVKAALAKLDAKKVGSAQKHIDGVNKWFEKSIGFAKANEERKRKEEDKEKAERELVEGAEKQPELTEEQKKAQLLQGPIGSVLIMHGNVLYEWSQVLAAVGKEWKPMLDSAVDKFRTAGAAEVDIRSALKNHSKKEDLDLGPDPEEAVAAEVVEGAKEAVAKAPEAKGLPSLEVKKKAKA